MMHKLVFVLSLNNAFIHRVHELCFLFQTSYQIITSVELTQEPIAYTTTNFAFGNVENILLQAEIKIRSRNIIAIQQVAIFHLFDLTGLLLVHEKLHGELLRGHFKELGQLVNTHGCVKLHKGSQSREHDLVADISNKQLDLSGVGVLDDIISLVVAFTYMLHYMNRLTGRLPSN